MTKKTKDEKIKEDEEYKKILNQAIKLGSEYFGAKVFFMKSDCKIKSKYLKVIIGGYEFFFIGAHNYLDFLQKRIECRVN